MKINKLTVQITLLLAIISLAISYIIDLFAWSDFWQNAMLGVFGSLLVAAIVSFVGYIHEKKKILDSVYQSLVLMYRNCCSLDVVLANLAKNLEIQIATQQIVAELEIARRIDNLKPIQAILEYSSFTNSQINRFFIELRNLLNSFYMEAMVKDIQIVLLEYQLMDKEKKLFAKYDDLTLQEKYDNVFKVLSDKRETNKKLCNTVEKFIVEMEKFYTPALLWEEQKKYIMAEVQRIYAELQKMNQQ